MGSVTMQMFGNYLTCLILFLFCKSSGVHESGVSCIVGESGASHGFFTTAMAWFDIQYPDTSCDCK